MSRLDRLKKQHPDLNISLIDIISYLDPTDSYKYVEFLIKNFKSDNDYYSSNKDEFMGYMGVFLFGSGEIETLNEFERHSRSNRIKIKDISKYNNFLELSEAVDLAQEIENRKKLEKEIIKIYEDNTWFVITPLSFQASKIYGSNTKWCVTQENYWVNYLSTHRLIYVINKNTGSKIAFSRNFMLDKNKRTRGNEIQAWNEEDKEIDPMSIIDIPDEIFLIIKKELQTLKTTGELTGIKNNTLLTTFDSFHGTINTDGDTNQMIISDENLRNVNVTYRTMNNNFNSRFWDLINHPEPWWYNRNTDSSDDLP